MSDVIFEQAIQKIKDDSALLHEWVHGDDQTVVETEGGSLRSPAKLIRDNQEAIDGFAFDISGKENKAAKDAGNGYVGLEGFKLRIKNAVGSVTSYLFSTALQEYSWQLPNKNGQLAVLSDITGTNSGTNTGDETATTIKNKLAIVTLSGANTGDETEATIRAKLNMQFIPVDSAKIGQPNGIVPLGADAKIAAAYLPSFVDDVLEVATFMALPAIGESGKIYVVLDANSSYRWSGSAYIELVSSPGTTDAVPEGATSKYFTEARVRATLLAGLLPGTNAVLTGTDTLITALAKLQKQISDVVLSDAQKAPLNGTGASGTWNINTTGTVKADASGNANTVHYLALVENVGGQNVLKADIELQYNPSTNMLSLNGLSVAGSPALTRTHIGAANGVAPLGADAKLPSTYMPPSVSQLSIATLDVGSFQLTGGSIYKSGGTAPAYYMSQDNTGRQHWYWNTSGGLSPTYAVGGEDAIDLMFTVSNVPGASGTMIFRCASGLGKVAGDAITWENVFAVDRNNAYLMGNALWHAGNLKIGVANGIAPLGSDNKIAAVYLPSFVDDVLEYAALANFPATGESGKIYVALNNGKIFRWSGSVYIEISSSPGSTDAVVEGATNLYFTQARAIAAQLLGFVTNTAAPVVATDSVVTAIGKLQAQLTAYPYDIAGGLPGKLVASDFSIVLIAVRQFTLPANLTGSRAVVVTPGASTVTLSLQKNNSQFATITFNSGSGTGTFAMASSVTFVPGDVIRVVAPSSADSQFSDCAFTLAGTLG